MSTPNLNINNFTVTLTKANSGTNDNSKFELKLPRQIQLIDHEVALRKAIILYSFPNISSVIGNNTFSYVNWAGTVRNIDLLSGANVTGAIFTYDQINDFIQQQMYNNGDYLIDEGGFPVYYLSIAANDIYGKVQISVAKVPTSLPTGYTIPSGGTYNGASAVCFQLVIPNTPIQTLLGFTANSYPTVQSVLSSEADFVSTTAPQITNTTSLILKSNLACDSEFTTVNNLLSTVIINAEPNSQITTEPIAPDFRYIPQNYYNKITIEICNQDGKAITDIMDNKDNVFEINIRKRS